MFGQLQASSFGWSYSLQSSPATSMGVTVTPGAGTEGSYVQLASSANLANDVYMVFILVSSGSTSAGIRDILVDIGTDPAGGTSYTQTAGINDLWCPQAAAVISSGYYMWFPFFIKAGSSVAARAQSNIATNVRVMARFYGLPSNPHAIRVGQYSETVGVSGNGGTPITCGNTAAEGSWTSIGTTTRDCWNWTLCTGHNVGTTTAQMYLFDLAYGDGTNYNIIIENQAHLNAGSTEATGGIRLPFNWHVPAGGTLYVRGSASGTAETCEVVAVGIGG